MILEMIDWLSAIIRDVRKLHDKDPAGYCRECTVEWPCRTWKLCDTREP